MNAKKHLVDAYSSWEQLTVDEGNAIQTGDWLRVRECQNSKQGLQKQIIRFTEAAQGEYLAAGQDVKGLDADIRPIINALIALESRNSGWVAGRQQAAERQRLDLDQATQNLRRVHKSYTTPSQAVWHSYS